MAAKTQAGIDFVAYDKMSNVARKIGYNLGSMFKEPNRQVLKFKSSLDTISNKLSFGGMSPFGGFISATAVAYGTKSLLNQAAVIEAAEKSIIFSSGSTEEGAKSLQFLKKTADDLGVSYTALIDGFKGFSGTMMGTVFQGERARKMFYQLAVASRVMGLDEEQQAGTYKAIYQMFNKTKIQAEELQTQLAEKLPGSTKTMGEAVGVNMEVMFKMMKKGELRTEKYIEAFTKLLEDKFSPGLNEASKSLGANLARMGNLWNDFVMLFSSSVVESGFLEELTRSMKMFLQQNREILKTGILKFFKLIGGAISFLAKNIDSIITAFKILIPVILTLKTISGVISLIGMLSNPIGWTVLAIGALVAAIASLYIYLDQWDGRFNSAKNSVWGLKDGLDGFLNIMTGLFDMFRSTDSESPLTFFEGLKRSIAGIVQITLGALKIFARLFDWFGTNGLVDSISSLQDSIKPFMNEWAIDPSNGNRLQERLIAIGEKAGNKPWDGNNTRELLTRDRYAAYEAPPVNIQIQNTTGTPMEAKKLSLSPLIITTTDVK